MGVGKADASPEQVALLSQSTKSRVESFIVSYVGYRFITGCNALFCCLWRNVEASCHKHFVVFSHNQHRRLLPCVTTRGTVAVVHRWPCWQHLPVAALTAGTKARYGVRIAISAYDTCIRHPCYGGLRRSIIAMPLGKEKLEWWIYPTVKKIRWYLFVLTPAFDTPVTGVPVGV